MRTRKSYTRAICLDGVHVGSGWAEGGGRRAEGGVRSAFQVQGKG